MGADKLKNLENENKRLKEEIQHLMSQRDVYKKLFETSADALSILDLETGKFIECNQSAIKMHGVETEENFLNLRPSDISPQFQPCGGSSEQMAIDRIQRTFNEGPQLFQWQHSRLNGTTFPCLVSLTALPMEDKKLIIAIGRDITELVETQEKLKEANLRLTESVKSGHIGLWDWDLITNQVRFSREYLEQIGLPGENYEDTFDSWKDRVHPEDLKETIENVRKSIDTCSKNHSALFRLRHEEGHYLWILSQASVIEDSTGHPIRMMGTHIDITERKNLEEELRQSQKMEAIGHLAGGIAHDFNNQLGCIMGFAELLELQLKEPQLIKYVRRIISGVEQSGNLTRQLLTFSRKQSVRMESVNIHAQLNEVIELLNRSIDKKISIHANYNAKDFLVEGDVTLIQNAFLNLGLNARDAMLDGGDLYITTRVNVPADTKQKDSIHSIGPSIQIDFRDTGCGIPDDIKERIFEPFFTTKELGKGTGMGLASVFGAIDQLSGRIELKTAIGKGSCFSIYLPLTNLQETNCQTKTLPLSPAVQNSMTILVVDDEEHMRILCGEILKKLGYQTLCANDGQQAVEVYANNKEDIGAVILDMMMPNMNGKEAYIELKKINPSVKVILSTGFAADNALCEMMDLGVAHTISKPFRLSALDEAISSISQE